MLLTRLVNDAGSLRWRSLVLFWVVQSVVAGALLVTWLTLADGVSASRGEYLGLGADFFERGWRLLTETRAWVFIGGVLSAVIIGQCLLLLPVRKPVAASSGGRSLMVSIATAGLLVAILVASFTMAVGYTWWLLRLTPIVPSSLEWPSLLAVLGGSWVVSSILLWRFVRRGRREDRLGRLSARLFTGTLIEVAAIIPLDVLARRRSDCYCLAGTFAAMIFAGAVGFVVFGPMIVLPLIARRRKRYYAGHCDACGYDMGGCLTAARCPECGTGWRPSNTSDTTPIAAGASAPPPPGAGGGGGKSIAPSQQREG